MTPLTILPRGDKGRSFTANLLSYAVADGLWEGGQADTDNKRPVWMALAGSELETKAFVANLLLGRLAEVPDRWSRRAGTKFEVLKSVGYAHHTAKIGGGVVTSLYLGDLVALDPGLVDPESIRFLMLPSSSWVARQVFDLDEARAKLSAMDGGQVDRTDEELRVLLAEGALFLLYLDRRSRYPMPQSPTFGAWLLAACIRAGIATRPGKYEPGGYRPSFERDEGGQFGFYMSDPGSANVTGGIAFRATHEDFGTVLAEQVQRWFGHPARDAEVALGA